MIDPSLRAPGESLSPLASGRDGDRLERSALIESAPTGARQDPLASVRQVLEGPQCSSAAAVRCALEEGWRAWRTGRYPLRYRRLQERPWETALDHVLDTLAPGAEILDVGSGHLPSVALARRTSDVRYVGLDISASELEKAPAGAYDEIVVGDLAQHMPQLEGRFDLILCARTLEHVRSTEKALAVLGRYLRPGGELLAELSGTFSAFALNRIIPRSIATRLLLHLTGRAPDTVFPAYYDRSWYSALAYTLSSGWTHQEVTPLFYGAVYFAFSRPTLALYVTVEELVFRRGVRNAATHYIIHAIK